MNHNTLVLDFGLNIPKDLVLDIMNWSGRQVLDSIL